MRMEQNTSIADSIDSADQKARYDAACRSLLSEKMILAWIMKSCLAEFRDCEVNEIAERYIEGEPQVSEVPVMPDRTNRIRGMSNEDTTLTEGKVTYDIRFYAITPANERVRVIINVEAQNVYYPGYPLTKRAVYYCARLISAQRGVEFTDSHYEDVKKVYSIWLCMEPPESRKNTITRYAIKEENVFGEAREAVRNYDLMSIVMIGMGDVGDDVQNSLLKLLNVLFSTETSPADKCSILQDEFFIPMTQRLETEVSSVCNLSEGVERRGIRKGIEQGIRKGIEQGIEQGIAGSIRSLMRTMGLTIEQAMSALEIPIADREKYAGMVKQ